MVQLYDAERGTPVGAITEAQLEFLMSELEEESARDRDYYIAAATVDMLEEDGAEPELVQLLRAALGGREGVELRWEQQ
jgi:hypothetical protein